MRRIIVAVVAVLSVASCGQTSKPTLLILGDSLTSGIELVDIRDRLIAEQGWGDVIVDGLSGRSINSPFNYQTVRGVYTYRAHLRYGLKPNAVIVALGTNDLGVGLNSPDMVASFDKVIREMLDLIGDVPVGWVNVIRWDEGYYADASIVFNETLATVAQDYPNLIIGDWYTYKDVSPYWDADDHLHPNYYGYQARAILYHQLAAELYSKVTP